MSVADNDREEARDAARFDNTRYVRVGDRYVDEIDLPQLEEWEQ